MGANREDLIHLHGGYKSAIEGAGYIPEPEVSLSGGCDPSVRFIGSHISVLKPYLFEGVPADKGIYMVQNCLRTRNASTLFHEQPNPTYGSFFTSLGGLAVPGSVNEVCSDVFDYIESELGVPRDEIRANIRSEDTDLVEACTESLSDSCLAYDTKSDEYYTHKIGINGVQGRNFNIALPSSADGTYEDVGNIIVINEGDKEVGVEIALGDTTILKQLKGLDHVLDAYDINLSDKIPSTMRDKFKDAAMTSTVLFQEGLRPSARDNRSRILRTYTKALTYYKLCYGLELEELDEILCDIAERCFSTEGDVSADILGFVTEYEQNLSEDNLISKEDATVLSNLHIAGVKL